MNSLKLDLEPFEMDAGNDAFSEVQTDCCSQSNPELDLDAFEVEGDDLAWEKEDGRPRRRSSRPASRRPRPVRSHQTSISWPYESRRQPRSTAYPRRPTLSRARRRQFVVCEPSAPCICPAHGTEFVRWLQSSLNRMFNLQLRVHGVMDRATRDALRRFQKEQGIPADGIAGPETEKALVEVRARRAGGTNGLSSAWENLEALDLDLTDLEWEGEVNRNSQEYIRWVQSSLNRIMGLRLAVDGISGPKTRSAIRDFQQQHGAAVDGIVGPETERSLIAAGAGNPPGMGAPSYTPPALSVPPPASTSSRVQLAQRILSHGNIVLWSYSPTSSSSSDGADAKSNMRDTANGHAARRSNYGNAPGGSVYLDSRLLDGMLRLANTYSFRVTSIAGGSHSADSRHYVGIAFDVDQINGLPINSSNSHYLAFMQMCRNLGATQVLGPGDDGHSTHVHSAWPRP